MDAFTISIMLGLGTILFFLTIGGYLAYSGLFSDFEVGFVENPFKKLRVFYKFAHGPYRECGPLFTEVYSIVPECRTIGIYYDDPSVTEEKNCRYCVGSIIEEGDECQVSNPEQAVESLTKEGFKELILPAVTHVICASHIWKTTLSILIAIGRVYPKMKEFIEKRKLQAGPFVEVYEGNSSRIVFWAPCPPCENYYTPEALEFYENLAEEQRSRIREEEASKLD